MKKQKTIIVLGVMLLGLFFSVYQYSEVLKTEVASATSTMPNPGHAWSSTECNSDSLCVDTINNRLGIGTANPNSKLTVNGVLEVGTGANGGAQLISSAGDNFLLISKTNTPNTNWTIGTGNGSNALDVNYPYITSNVNFISLMKGNVGIGTTNPTAPLVVHQVGNNVQMKIGREAGQDFSIGRNFNTGVLEIQGNQAGYYNIALAPTNGSVGIGTTAPGYTLTVAGTAWVTSGSWSGSDIRWKKNISTLSSSSSLNKIMALNPVTYDWRVSEFPEMKFSNDAQLGFIAQDVEKIIPEVVTTNNEGYKGISYEKIVPVLTSAIQEQEGKIEQLKNIVCLDHPLIEMCK